LYALKSKNGSASGEVDTASSTKSLLVTDSPCPDIVGDCFQPVHPPSGVNPLQEIILWLQKIQEKNENIVVNVSGSIR
jgi:hypothetical protein